jgi:hypothetical protein
VRLTLLAVLALVVAGCREDGDAPASLATPLEYCLESWRVGGARSVACRLAAATEVAIRAETYGRDTCERLQAAADAGRAGYDPRAARACIDEIASTTCEEWRAGATPACDDVLSGRVQLGGACLVGGDECADGWCDSSLACPGACAPFAALGEVCVEGACGPGLSCDGATGRCVTRIPPGDVGEPCGTDSPARCLPDLVCNGTACVARLEVGEPCIRDSQCVAGSYCGPYTDTQRVCAPRAREGERCDHQWCVFGAVCDESTRVCVHEPIPGERCLTSDPPAELCVGGYCDEGGICRAWRGEGAACEVRDQCDPASDCVAGACAPFCWP